MADELDFGATLRGMAEAQKVFGRYTLLKILGRGGMGVVWLARDEELEREVALKFLPEIVAMDQQAVFDLKRETRRSLELTHPHIIRIYDFVQDGRSAAISMEYVPGDNLANFKLSQLGHHCEPAQLSAWVRQLCDALSYAHHTAEIVHRDLKPANLMIDGKGLLKIADFGIAASVSDSVSRVSVQAGSSGTPVYMSPQQMMGEKPAVSDDIYALGATLYDLLTGKPPFHGGNIIAQVQGKVPPRMADRRRDLGVTGRALPEGWEETIAACLAKDPAERPAAAAEVAARLGLSGVAAPTSPPRSNVPPRSKAPLADPPPRKSKIPAVAGIAAGVAGLAVAGWWFAVYAPEQRRIEAERQAVQHANLERERLALERLANARGGLIVQTVPTGAEVRVGAVAVETSPLTLREQRLGTYPVRIRLVDYEDWDGEVEVVENEFVELRVELVRSTGTLRFDAHPEGTEIVVEGAEDFRREWWNGQPEELAVPTGTYRVSYRRPGWLPRMREIAVGRQADFDLTESYFDAGREDTWRYHAELADLQAAGADGDLAAQVELGDRLGRGAGVRVDHDEASRRYRVAWEKGSDNVHGRLAMITANWADQIAALERGLAVADPAAVLQARKLQAEGRAEAKRLEVSDTQLAHAVTALTAAAERGQGEALFMVGWSHYHGLVAGATDASALRWLRDAMARGDRRATLHVAAMQAHGRGVERDDETALQGMREAAEAGVPAAYHDLGFMFFQGRGVTRDEAEALRWYRRAAEAGHAAAMNQVGWMYEQGQGVTPDQGTTLAWYRRGIEAGSGAAMNNLGRAYQHGNGVTADDTEAVRWYRQAAESGHAWGMTNLGFMIANARGVASDDAEAVRWYRRAAELDQAAAMRYLGFMYANGRGLAQDEAEGLRWYKRAVEAGDTVALNDVGLAYQHGRGVEPDHAEAVGWYRRAAEAGNDWGYYNLGEMYFYGRGVDKNEPAAVEWYRRAAAAGNATAMRQLGWVFTNARGVEQDHAEALNWYQQAAAAGHASAMNDLGIAYQNGRGVRQDEAEAVGWYRRAAEAGNVFGMTNLGSMLANGRGVTKNEREAAEWYRRAAEQDHPRGQYLLGVAFANGRGVPQNHTEAAQWYRRAADAGESGSMVNLGVAYENGRGVSQSHAEAVRWYRRAADAGSLIGMSNLGLMYANARGVAQNEAEAVRWYRRAADAGHARAMGRLGRMYADGRGVSRNDAQAVAWYRRGAAGGDSASMTNLGFMYSNGRGVRRNRDEAIRLYRQAARMGEETAQNNLRNLGLGW